MAACRYGRRHLLRLYKISQSSHHAPRDEPSTFRAPNRSNNADRGGLVPDFVITTARRTAVKLVRRRHGGIKPEVHHAPRALPKKGVWNCAYCCFGRRL